MLMRKLPLGPDADVKDVLAAVHDLLKDPDRWCKDLLQLGKAFCLLGAINYVQDGHHGYLPTGIGVPEHQLGDPKPQMTYAAVQALGFHGPIRAAISTAVNFNNAEATTHEVLMARLRAAL